ncbi:substrate-binding domain-containing protein [Chthonobacter albigriseus]|uniref:substrate-binding domain-containing protein n=1 Tax=Chthonobacter albigriseus TaxID=1683161 RepID=UPI0015EF7BBB|nr:substrate-binding domain-containing protein [Chthonobacter albigriseus]
MAMLSSTWKCTIAAALWLSAIAPGSAETLKVVGTGDGLDMLRALAALYRAEEGGDVTLPASIGSGGGIAAVAAGTEKLARVARALKDTERAAGLEATPIAEVPSAFFVHAGVGIDGLSAAQVADIFSGRITNWSEVGGPDLKIRVVRREDADSTLQVLRSSMPGWDTLEFTPKSKTAVTTQDAIETVRTVEGAIGFGPFSASLAPDTTVLKIDGRFPTDPGYPSAVRLTLVFKKDAATPDVKEFVDFARSDRGMRLMAAYGAVPARE